MGKNKMIYNPVVPEIEDIKKEVTSGVVTNCFKLNIRKKANLSSEVVSVVDLLTELKIDESKSTKEWLFVTDEKGNAGYCMKQYVAIRH